MRIVLSPKELYDAARVGVARQVLNLQSARQDRHGFVPNPWEAHILGSVGEYAVAKITGKPWHGAATLENFKAPDVGHLQVRATSFPQGRLVLHPPDSDTVPWVCARVMGLVVDIPGWMYGHEAKKPCYWQMVGGHKRPAFFVDNEHLHDIGTLP